jgi:hypothetical protein
VFEWRPEDRTQETLEGIRQQLGELDSKIGDEKKHPSIPPDEREKELITIRTTLDTLNSQLQDLSRRMQAPRKSPTPKPAPSQPPASPVRVGPQPSTGRVTPAQHPAPGPSAPLPPRDETHRTEKPAPPIAVAPGDSILAQPPPSPPGIPAAGNEPTPTLVTAVAPQPPLEPQGVAPVPPPATAAQASQQPNVPGPELPVAPAVPQTAAPRERRTLTFLPTPEGLLELAEFLDTQPRIVHFTFEPPQS